MANEWIVKFTDDDEDGILTASFNSKRDADLWISNQEVQGRYDPNGFEVVEGPYQDKRASTSESKKIDALFAKVGVLSKIIAESWDSSYDDKPTNLWGEKWLSIDPLTYIWQAIEDTAKDCLLDPEEDGPKLDRLTISNIHIVDGGNLIVAVYGGANGGGLTGGCNFKSYLALLKKFVSKLLDGMFVDVWLIDWENDCCDDCWSLRLVLKPTTETLQKFEEKGLLDFDDSNSSGAPVEFDPQVFLDAAKAIGINCTSAEQTKPSKYFPISTSILVNGNFQDKIPLDYLIFNWHAKSDEFASRGWYQGTRCMNKWNGIIIDNVLNKIYPNGIKPLLLAVNESAASAKLWIDDIRPAPNGYIWLKSVNLFADYVAKNGLDSILVIDLDHDAGEYQKDGGDYIRCLDYLDFIGAKGIAVRVHSANPVGVKSMRQIILKNGWREVYDIIDNNGLEE